MSESAPNAFNFETEENPELTQPTYEATRINDGLGFGEGDISGEDESETLGRGERAIQSGRILVQVSHDEHGEPIKDDGCGDGREVNLIFRLKDVFKRSLNRAKVFGGAVAMAGAALIGTGRAKGNGVEATFDNGRKELDEKGVEYGAHTAEHASGEDSGCGAIDKAPKIIRAAIKYEPQIRATIDALGADTTDLDDVYSNFYDFVENMPADETYSGRRVMDRIKNAGKFVKQLGGKHREKFIVLNTVRGYTVDQELVRRETGGRAQVFAVDIWRLDDIATGLHPDDDQLKAQTYLSELIYTLATSAVLTKGDLPVYMIQEAPQAVVV